MPEIKVTHTTMIVVHHSVLIDRDDELFCIIRAGLQAGMNGQGPIIIPDGARFEVDISQDYLRGVEITWEERTESTT